MLLIKLDNILYSLKNFRAYVLQIPTTKSSIALLANNTIAFTLTKKEIKKVNKYNTLLFTYNNLKYLDETYRHLNYQYPTLKKTNIKYANFFNQIFKLTGVNNLRLTNIIIKREKNRFKVRLVGLLGYIKMSTIFSNFINLWNCKQSINYKDFISLMLCWLRNNIVVYTNSSFINFFLKKKDLKVVTKQNKVFYKKNAIQKTLIIFSNENIVLN
jgi:hypothetical protein